MTSSRDHERRLDELEEKVKGHGEDEEPSAFIKKMYPEAAEKRPDLLREEWKEVCRVAAKKDRSPKAVAWRRGLERATGENQDQ